MPEINSQARPPGRNDPCPCGSGLKFKNCHGDQVLQQKCQWFLRLFLGLQIMERQLRSGKITQEAYDQRTSAIREELVEGIVGEEPDAEDQGEPLGPRPEPTDEDLDTDEIAGDSPGPEIVPLRPKESINLDQLRQDNNLIRCSCGNVYPAGSQCAKCKRKEQGEYHPENDPC